MSEISYYKIERLPIPEIKKPVHRGGSAKGEFFKSIRLLKTGECFLSPEAIRSISGRISKMRKDGNLPQFSKFTCRSTPQGTRIWRIK
jgi:hypothetical protein